VNKRALGVGRNRPRWYNTRVFKFVSKLLDTNEKELKRLRGVVEKINALEEETKKLTDEEMKAKTADLKLRLERGETVNEVLPEAFALVREAAVRTIGQRHYDVQLMAGVAFAEGKIAEQKTGEGKTLSATLALYLQALTGQGAHLVTVNDYLARRDAGWMGPIFHLLGLSIGVIYSGEGRLPAAIFDPEFNDASHSDERLRHLRPAPRKEAYAADITYGTNNEFGFDYLRDNMVQRAEDMVQRGHHYAIVDEVDSILIDEARTPLIISAPDTEPTEKYYQFAQLVERLSSDTDYEIDEKLRTANLTEHGVKKVEKMLGVDNLYEKDFETLHHIENALKARTLFMKDKDYIVKDDQVIIVDEFTGRLMYGRRWSEGLHQAVEAKEGVKIQQESKTLATISIQNYFRMYELLAGMTGTAATEAEEFEKIYELQTVVIPTHRPMVRVDNPDIVYKTPRAKYAAIVREIIELYQKGQPVLVGTTSIEKNEIISNFLRKKRVPHQVLNAKHHEKEAEILAQAGRKGAVTVATNMAGRGVDIVLGGAMPERPADMSQKEWEESKEYKKWRGEHKEVVKLGGLFVIGSERHESRRIDNQLRGRSGRQGDPGGSRFYVALMDDLMRIFGGEKVAGLMTALKIPEDQPIEHGMVSRSIEQSQVKVEGFHFDTRKHLVEYDDVMNQQRQIIYDLRKKTLEKEDLKGRYLEKGEGEIKNLISVYAPESLTAAEKQKLVQGLAEIVPQDNAEMGRLNRELEKKTTAEEVEVSLKEKFEGAFGKKEKEVGEPVMREMERFALRMTIDRLWMDHLDAIDDLREGVRLRAYGQRDPLVEYKNEAFGMFERLVAQIDYEALRRLFRIQVTRQPATVIPQNIQAVHPSAEVTGEAVSADVGVGEQVSQTEQLPAVRQVEGRKGKAKAGDLSQLAQAMAGLPTTTGEKARVASTVAQPGVKKEKVGRNDPCPCGAINPNTGKVYKYKKCGLINAPYHRG
jgi:preprotein translocase subunit SecA